MDLRQQIMEFEGVVPHAYADSLGYLTIGCGRLIDQRKGGGLSQDEIEYLLDNDLARVKAAVLAALPWAKDLSPIRQAVLYGMAFQMGGAGLLGFKGTLTAVREGRYGDAAKGMLQSRWAKQTPARADRLARQMLTNAWS